MMTIEKATGKGHITIEELTNVISEFLRETYKLDLNIPIKRNNRLRSSAGRYVHERQGTPVSLEISGFLQDYGDREVVIDIMKHEAVHYALHVLGKPYSDGDEYFENELRKQDVTSTGVLFVGLAYIATCDKCSKEVIIQYKRVIDRLHRYQANCCKSSMTFVGERVYDGTEVVK